MNATGTYVPPLFIYARMRVAESLQRGGPTGSIYAYSKNGWMTDEVFLTYMKHFVAFTKASQTNKVLMILDNHVSHISLAIYNYSRENGVTLLSIPPHSSHRLQPLDVTFYGPLKTAYNYECQLSDLPALFSKAYGRVATIEKAVKGFETTGIFPVNPNIFPDEIFAASDLLTKERDNVNPESEGHVQQNLPGKNDSVDNQTDHEKPSTSKTSNVDVTQHVAIEIVSPIPQPSKSANTKQGKKRQHSEILNSTPLKTAYEEANMKKKRVIMNRKNAPPTGKGRPTKIKSKSERRNVTKLDENSSEDEIDEHNLCDDDSDDDLEAPQYFVPSDDKENQDECVLCGEFGQNNEIWFRCTICGKWTHKQCSGVNKAAGYICDFCK